MITLMATTPRVEPQDPPPFGRWLASQLDRRGWTQADLARESGLGPSVISRYMAGQSAPAIDNARTLANTLGVPLLAVLVEGGQLTAEEAQARPEVSAADDLPDAEIARQVARRLGVSLDSTT
ncbi:helix-turn-helix transcriptional regulator [Saccharopolyspora sp. 6V]|uniref:helix-turn-helix domain-containing protein n=1 Tax=Saccharopolyspora sp. 6V TaxID=2877239 RepID=UPI001CD432CD|nr:helix-turn-helix transcriptional regulator [Saccharopolyspora sp. 6V]MCA1195101.1 helix-turn-helix domain-containing protein [Saccharopolyspora sp. 6V]